MPVLHHGFIDAGPVYYVLADAKRSDKTFCRKMFTMTTWFKCVGTDSNGFVIGILHREGGPAKLYKDGREEWVQDGLYHRLDGPAIVPRPGEEEGSYWCIRGISVYSFKEYQELTGCSDSTLLILKLRWKEIEQWV